jgi:putative transposase
MWHFTINIGFERIHATPEMVTSAMQLYFTGESLRNVQKFLKLQGVKITRVSIYNWIRKYVGLMKAYPEKITPIVADAWRADELYLKVRCNPKYLFPLMDDLYSGYRNKWHTQNIHLTSDPYFRTLENWLTRRVDIHK